MQSIYDGNEDTQSYIFINSGLLISNGKDCKSTHSKLYSHSNYILLLKKHGGLGCSLTEFGARINSGELGINHNLEKPKKFTLSCWFLAPTSQAAVTLAAQRDFSISFTGFSQDWSCPNVCATRRHQPPQDLQRATGGQKKDVR